ncbi:MAG: hypothetical protein GY810_11805 [Aureispira sp.]|nr:hypothetical protein [Aureispira sp.]
MAYPKNINKLKKKLDLYNGIIKSNANNTFALKKRMEVRFLLGEKEGAIEDLTKLILLDPKNQNLKNHPFNPHRPDAEPIDPKYAELFVNLGLIKMKNKSYAEALDAYEKAILIGKEEEDLIIAYTDACLCAVEMMNWEKGYLYSSYALQIRSMQEYKKLKEKLEYYQAFSFVSKVVDNHDSVELNSSEYKLLDKHIKGFLSFFKDDTVNKAGWSRNLIIVALAYEKLGKQELSLDTINNSLRLQESAGAYVIRAILLLKKGDDQEFAQDLKTAFRLDPEWVKNMFPDMDFEKELTAEQKEQLMQSNILMQPSKNILNEDSEEYGRR